MKNSSLNFAFTKEKLHNAEHDKAIYGILTIHALS